MSESSRSLQHPLPSLPPPPFLSPILHRHAVPGDVERWCMDPLVIVRLSRTDGHRKERCTVVDRTKGLCDLASVSVGAWMHVVRADGRRCELKYCFNHLYSWNPQRFLLITIVLYLQNTAVRHLSSLTGLLKWVLEVSYCCVFTVLQQWTVSNKSQVSTKLQTTPFADVQKWFQWQHLLPLEGTHTSWI